MNKLQNNYAFTIFLYVQTNQLMKTILESSFGNIIINVLHRVNVPPNLSTLVFFVLISLVFHKSFPLVFIGIYNTVMVLQLVSEHW